MTIDYSEFEDKDGPGDNMLGQLLATADYQKQLEQEVAELEASLKAKKAELFIVASKTLPDLMEEAGLEDFKMRDGAKVSLKEDIRASISKERAAAACKWLRDNGFGALVKNQVIAEFGMGEDEKAKAAIDALTEAHLGLVHQAETVHPSTLSSWVRTKMKDDPDMSLPVELLGISRTRLAQIK